MCLCVCTFYAKDMMICNFMLVSIILNYYYYYHILGGVVGELVGGVGGELVG